MMTDIRRKAQNKLRRKFGYSTNDNYNRGTILEKGGEPYTAYQNRKSYTAIDDIHFVMDWRIDSENTQIDIYTERYSVYGKENGETGYEKIGECHVSMSLEELDLIHAIAHEIAEEGDWNGQVKYLKSIRRKNR